MYVDRDGNTQGVAVERIRGSEPAPAWVFLCEREALSLIGGIRRPALPVQLLDAAARDLVQRKNSCLEAGRLDTQLFEERFQVGFVDGDFSRLRALQWDFHRVFIEGLKEAHLGHGVLFAARKRPAVLPSPGFEG